VFELSVGALAINDPYVSERVLAASYGVAMARQYDISEREVVANALAEGAQRLYAAMFAPGAPHATTHWLARNYARRTIEIASRLRPDMLSEEQLERARPPFREGGIRDWGQNQDKNEEEYRGGNPFGLLDDDPMGQLGPDISKYQSDTPQYEVAKANLWWRIYDLGYSPERFDAVDSMLANQRQMPGSSADGSSVDGYGRKYCWIATCELAGYRDDLGLLRAEWKPGHENWSHVDLDPSFPEELSKHQLVHGDLLGDRQTTLAEWVARGPDLTFEELCEVEELNGERGPWILLIGHITQQDEHNGRNMFCFLQGALIEGGDVETIEDVSSQASRIDPGGMYVPDIHYTYAGEIPWCETYPANEASAVPIMRGHATATSEEPPAAIHDDVPRSAESAQSAPTEYHIDKGDDATTIYLTLGVGIPGEAVHMELVQAPMSATCTMTMPVTTHGWESYHSELNSSTGAHVPARQIADLLGLTSHPQTFDLYDPQCRRASASFEYGGRFSNRQDFTYLRKDLLDQYLAGSGQRLVWVIYGERAVHHARSNRQWQHGDAPPYARYERVRVYNTSESSQNDQ